MLRREASPRVAAAEPAVSLILGLILLVASHPGNHVNPLLGNLLAQLGWLNLVLAIFNLLPGLPLDGGLILKSLVWRGPEVSAVAFRWQPRVDVFCRCS